VLEKIPKNSYLFIDHLERYNFAKLFLKNRSVLDAACGTGYGVNILRGSAKKTYGCDISEETILYAKNKYKKVNNWFVKDLNCQFPQTKFDVVVSFETIEHLKNKKYFLEQVRYHSNRFIFSIPIECGGEFHVRLYSVEDIMFMAYEHFRNWHIRWFAQERGKTVKQFNYSTKINYLIGVADKCNF